MKKCKNLSKSLNGNLRCKLLKQQITLLNCKNCSQFIVATTKPIKKASKNRIYTTEETWNKVFERDEGRCALCGLGGRLQLHHIHGRGKDLTNDVDNCILLCAECHLNRVHKNQKLYRPILEQIVKEKGVMTYQ